MRSTSHMLQPCKKRHDTASRLWNVIEPSDAWNKAARTDAEEQQQQQLQIVLSNWNHIESDAIKRTTTSLASHFPTSP